MIYLPYSKTSTIKDSNRLTYLFFLLRIFSYAILSGILIAISCSKSSTEKQQFKYIYYLSKILTIKSIILNNHYSEILDGFTDSGDPLTVPNTYRNLLKLVKIIQMNVRVVINLAEY